MIDRDGPTNQPLSPTRVGQALMRCEIRQLGARMPDFRRRSPARKRHGIRGISGALPWDAPVRPTARAFPQDLPNGATYTRGNVAPDPSPM